MKIINLLFILILSSCKLVKEEISLGARSEKIGNNLCAGKKFLVLRLLIIIFW